MVSRFSTALLVTMALAFVWARPAATWGFNPQSDSHAATAQADGGVPQDVAQAAEHEITDLLNQARKEKGLEPLAVDDRLVNAARAHSRLMSEKHLLSHGFPGEPELPQRLASAGIRYDRSGENVAFTDKDAQSAHNGLMHSPPHRANILNTEYNVVGVGVVKSGNRLWVTEDFAHRLEFYTADQAAKMIAAEFATLRRQAGQKPLTRSSAAGLDREACQMAHTGDLSAKKALANRPAGFSLAFTTADPKDLPSSLHKMAQQPGLARYQLGVCFAQSAKYPSGEYWVLMTLE